jgi:ABC-type transport system involved in multi-copper enzyme maturation permease subunit
MTRPMIQPMIQPRLISAEIMKIRTTRAAWIFLGTFTLLSAAALLTSVTSHHDQLYPQQDLPGRAQALAQAARLRTPAGAATIAASMMTSGQFLTVLVAMLLGIHIMTSEIGQRTLTATFLVTPRRERVIVAKLAAAVAFGALFWLIATVLDGVVTPVFLASQRVSASLTAPGVIRAVLLGLLAFVLWAAFGLGLGAVIRSQVASAVAGIAIYAGGAAVAELIFPALYDVTHQGWLLGAPVLAPAVASLVMTTPAPAFPHAPPQWAGAAVMAGYALALAATGIVQTRRRDVS